MYTKHTNNIQTFLQSLIIDEPEYKLMDTGNFNNG